MIKIKHNKIKNTAIIFESLVRKITAEVLDNKDSSICIKIVKEFFNKNTELRKEFELYNLLIKKSFDNEIKASSFIDLVLEERKKINNNKLKIEKYNIIKKIKENFDINEFFATKIENYPVYASIYKIFEYSNLLNEISNPVDLINSKFTIVNHLIRKDNNQQINTLSNILSKEPTSIRLLAQKIIIDEFNNKFNNKLLPSQKELLREYINSMSNTPILKQIIEKKLTKINETLNKIIKKVPDNAIKIKLEEVIKNLNNIKNVKHIKENHILAILKTYSLIYEIKKHLKNNNCAEKKIIK